MSIETVTAPMRPPTLPKHLPTVPKTDFQVADLGNRCYAINDRGRTVATITSQGSIDWLLQSPLHEGPAVTSLRKETHLGSVQGLQLLLTCPSPGTLLRDLVYTVEEDGARMVIEGRCATADGRFESTTRAALITDGAHSRYLWQLETVLTCNATESVNLPLIEYNNIYPMGAGRCMLFAPQKRFSSTLMVDEEGTVWRFPHQHLMHYSRKIDRLRFTEGTLAGFFSEPFGSPVVVVDSADRPPHWAICDMYYDLHCNARNERPLQPGEQVSFRYTIKYLSSAEADQLLEKSQPIPVDEEDFQRHDYPRLELGLNRFDNAVNIGGVDDASGFRPNPPVKIWDREVGHSTRGSLRLTNPTPAETVWSAEPASQIPLSTTLRITAKAKTEAVQGKGLFIRVRYHTYVWHPQPHVEWAETLESSPVSGTTNGWVQVSVPPLRVPEEHFDYQVQIDVVLDGSGVAWLTDVNIDLDRSPDPVPQIEKAFLPIHSTNVNQRRRATIER